MDINQFFGSVYLNAEYVVVLNIVYVQSSRRVSLS